MASTLKHLRSSTADKRPTASGLADGQLAINTASGTPGLFFKDSASQVVKVGPVHVGPTPPNDAPAGSSGNSRGELWVDNSLTTPGLNYYSGTAFVNLTPSGTTSAVGLVELATNAETQTGSDSVRAVTPASLQSKVSDSVSTASSVSIASSTAVKTAYDLAAAALPVSGGRVTGTLEIGPSGFIAFEGSSDDSFETFLTAVNPTADRTITFPNITGTLITDADTGTVTNTMLAGSIATTKLANGALPSGVTVNSSNIVDGSIVNADISASAAIAYSKLSLGTSIVDGDISTTAAIAGTKISPNFGSQNIVTTGNVNINSGTFYVDAVNNRVGVGTATPGSSLELSGSGSACEMRLRSTDTTNAIIRAYVNSLEAGKIAFTSGRDLFIETAGSERLRLDASGNLGLGVVPSGWDGTITGPLVFGTSAKGSLSYAGGATSLGENYYRNATGFRFVTAAAASIYQQTAGSHVWYSSSNTPSVNGSITFTQAMTLDASGNLGIGETSPTNRLHVKGTQNTVYSPNDTLAGGVLAYFKNASTTNSTDATIRLEATGSTNFALVTLSSVHTGDGSSAFTVGTRNAGGSVTERLRLDASGNLGLGVVPSANGSIYYRTFELGKAGCGLFVGTSSLSGSELTYFAGNAVLSYNAGPLWSYGNAGGAAAYGIEDGVHKWLTTTTTGTTGGAITFAQAMTLDASGRLLIGQTGTGLQAARSMAWQGSGEGALYMSHSTSDGNGDSFINFGYNANLIGKLIQVGTTGIGLYSNDALTFGTAGSERMRIDSSGNFLVGLTTGAKFSVSYGGNDTHFGLGANYDNYITAGSSGVTIFRNGTTERARIDSSGRLLVGTTSARNQLGITPGIQSEGTSFNQGTLSLTVNSTTQYPLISLARSGGTSLGSNTIISNGDIIGKIFFTAADGVDMDSSVATIEAVVDGTPGSNDLPGRLVFSTTADGAASPTERMRIGNGGATGLYCDATNDTLYASSAAAAGTTRYLFIGKYSATSPIITGTNSILIFTNGNIQNTNNSYGAISDIKLKENIVDASSQWSDIKALQVRNYNFKEGQTHTQIGLIAQEVELVSPGLVTESPDRDAEGNDLGTVTKSVNYSVLYMKAVKALQEAMERIENLEAKVAALEAS